jgi:hypothetical protein
MPTSAGKRHPGKYGEYAAFLLGARPKPILPAAKAMHFLSVTPATAECPSPFTRQSASAPIRRSLVQEYQIIKKYQTRCERLSIELCKWPAKAFNNKDLCAEADRPQLQDVQNGAAGN